MAPRHRAWSGDAASMAPRSPRSPQRRRRAALDGPPCFQALDHRARRRRRRVPRAARGAAAAAVRLPLLGAHGAALRARAERRQRSGRGEGLAWPGPRVGRAAPRPERFCRGAAAATPSRSRRAEDLAPSLVRAGVRPGRARRRRGAAAAAGARSSDVAGRDASIARERAALRRPADAPVLHHVLEPADRGRPVEPLVPFH